ncbi:MerR family transcriptional regulator [Pontibacillus sp. ALD_SL1]|uniref:MerR family transcriptional regulator n=1 Tax=Pontibacillus sp. ALD_SL1 TaxID=2777185 RepID=UPI001A97BEB7|nr:MerR family transcriptional regulator [Pontibacillus sp. ALD_SL1]QST00646.1 MerR family transcriptional regulator [Pontibacillus sp. ALD_SL1]
MKIKEAANRLNTTPRTIRFYEEKGLIQPDKGENDYRSYNEHHLWRLQTILSLREVGMSTEQIKHTLQNEEKVERYLNVQRSALYEEWLEIKDMIGTIDQMLHKSADEGFC